MKVISNSTADTESIIKHELCILKIYFQNSMENVYLINSTQNSCNYAAKYHRIQKQRIYNALLKSSSEEVINFDNVLKKIING